MSLSVTGSEEEEGEEEGRGGGSRRRGAGTAAAAAPAGALNGRQYHQLDIEMMVWTTDVLDCRAASDSSYCLVADLCSICSNLALNLRTSAKMFGDPAPLLSETRTRRRGCFDIRYSSAARSDLSTIEMQSTGQVLMASTILSSSSAHWATTRARPWADSMAKVRPAWSAHLRQPTQATSSTNTARVSPSPPRHDE